MSWHAFVVALLVVGAWRAERMRVDRVLPPWARRWIQHPSFEVWLFLAAFVVGRVFSPSVHESTIWSGLAFGAAFGLLRIYQ